MKANETPNLRWRKYMMAYENNVYLIWNRLTLLYTPSIPKYKHKWIDMDWCITGNFESNTLIFVGQFYLNVRIDEVFYYKNNLYFISFCILNCWIFFI